MKPDTQQLLHPTTWSRLNAAAQLNHHAYLLEASSHQGVEQAAIWLLRCLDPELSLAEIMTVRPVDGKSVSVSQIRQFGEHMWRTPQRQGGIRAGLILEAATMSTEAANALLKLLEEPPDRAVIVLAASYVDSLPATVKSRVLTVPFLPLQESQVLELLSELPAGTAREIAQLSRGLPVYATELAKSEQELMSARQAKQDVEGFGNGDLSTRFAIIANVLKRGGAEQFVRDLLYTFGQKSSILERSAEIEAGLWGLRALRAHVQPKLVLEWLALQL